MSSDGRIGAELGPVLTTQSGQGSLANVLRSGQAANTATTAISLVHWFAIGLFMFGFPAALFGLFFAHDYSWTLRVIAGIATLVVPPLLIIVSGGRRTAGLRP